MATMSSAKRTAKIMFKTLNLEEFFVKTKVYRYIKNTMKSMVIKNIAYAMLAVL